MELKEFITESLEQIAQGARDAQATVAGAGGYVNPAMTHSPSPDAAYFGNFDSHHSVFLVDFDVAVTVGEEMKGEGGAKLKVAGVLSIGGSGAAGSSSETTSRIKFKIPLALPVDSGSKARAEQNIRDQDAKVRTSNSNIV